ncbi:LEM domain-containing protein 1 [Dasypus novemcinctus]|uniref:LEM domain-containing protein 1 n=1 Tax=Dasypus novemcinctus TaxID=9361 RepID=UPI0003291AAE|nr:LEM domain-containing protein 1 [Dasypus novemcinctus]
MVDVKSLTDSELEEQLCKLGYSPGPILPSTRKVYQNKLVQLLTSAPRAPPATNGPREPDVPPDSDDSEELNTTIVLKGGVILSTENDKAPKKRPEAPTARPRAPDNCHQDYRPSRETRSSRAVIKEDSESEEENYCALARFFRRRRLQVVPAALAVLGIFVIVVFVYITVERKPFFG